MVKNRLPPRRKPIFWELSSSASRASRTSYASVASSTSLILELLQLSTLSVVLFTILADDELTVLDHLNWLNSYGCILNSG